MMMKRIFLISVITLVAAAFGCSREEAEPEKGNIHAKSIEVSIRQDGAAQAGVGSRAPVSPVTDLTRFVLEVYEGSTASGTAARRIEQSTGAFKYDMADGAQYTLVFWADYGTPDDVVNDHYDASDLKAVKVLAGQTASRDAFCGSMVVTSGVETSYGITLNRGVAQVNFIQKEALLTSDNTLEVKFAQTYRLNVSTGGVSEINDGLDPVPATYSYSGIAKVGAGVTIAKGHVIVPSGADNKALMELTTTFNPNKPDQTVKTIANVPLQMNYKTNITGAYSNLADLTTTLDCNQVWGDPDYEAGDVVLPEIGYFVYGDGSISEEFSRPASVSGIASTRAESDTCIGIVFWVDPMNKRRAKIICSAYPGHYSTKSWSTNGTDIPGSYSRTDGKANTEATKSIYDYLPSNYPIVGWCAARTEGGYAWYIPAIDEMKDIEAQKSAVNAAYKVIWPIPKNGRYSYNLDNCMFATSTTINATKYKLAWFSGESNSVFKESESDKNNSVLHFAIADITF